ncbi:MFS general substrate transporter [Lepidopterella palustris CBS 459.81]|uniref:MFS general substrate transporter n=1 Tax=Lepidopterella palustris CBS 459.81 TaxID=1314670 RepID=A0A8E2JHL3_9PEZI|nr:MFS general substrate transporter [Lepidopterella palustris CBS 459.81]
MEKNIVDIESGHASKDIPHWKLLIEQGVVTPAIRNWNYDGQGTEDDPYVVEWIENDPRNPMRWPNAKKWTSSLVMAGATLAVSFCSSAFSGGIFQLMFEFNSSQEVATLGLSLFVLGFALGPLLWAPLSELYGRQVVFIATFTAFVAFNAGCAGSQNMATVLICRFFAGSFGSSPLTNAGGVVADLFNAKERGLAMGMFSLAPFMGPVLGPIVGGFLGMSEGWRWVEGLMAIFSGVLWIAGILLVPETYPPVLLRRRAETLSRMTGKIYRSRGDIDQGSVTLSEAFSTGLQRPWILLFSEPIVLLLSVYMAIIYGTLYMMFGAYPIVYQENRGWSEGIGGLPFIGVAIGMIAALLYTTTLDHKRYRKAAKDQGGFATPEDRLPPSIIGGIALPIGLFWFAWSNYTSVHWMASVTAGAPFGFGMVLVFLSVMNYLIDAYTIFAASVLAANSILRSLFGAAFPLFTTQMYHNLGIHWASTIPAFLALACLPFPFLFYKYGASIRLRCKYSAQSDAFMKKMHGQMPPSNDVSEHEDEEDHEKAIEKEDDVEQEAADYSFGQEEEPRFERIKTAQSARARARADNYNDNPYGIDRVNTRESFKSNPSRRGSLSRPRSRSLTTRSKK